MKGAIWVAEAVVGQLELRWGGEVEVLFAGLVSAAAGGKVALPPTHGASEGVGRPPEFRLSLRP